MSDQPSSPQRQPIFSQIDVTNLVSEPMPAATDQATRLQAEQVTLLQLMISQQKQLMAQQQRQHMEMMASLRELVDHQRRQGHLISQMVNMQTQAAQQRAGELKQWRASHPHLSVACRSALEMLGRAQTEYYDKMVSEIEESGASLEYGDYVVNEFIDRFGPRLVHLNSLLQLLSQLAMPPGEEAELLGDDELFRE